jgi:sulfane dehydrogenase subunit SoxC
MNDKGRGRRRFLKEGAALAGLAVGGMQLVNGQTPGTETPEVRPKDARAYGERSRFETVSRWPIKGDWQKPETVFSVSGTPLQDLAGGIITPNGSHYYIDASAPYPLPDIDPRQHRIAIHGMVDRPLILTMEELKLLPSVSRIHFLQCVVGGVHERHHLGFHETAQMMYGSTSCSEWTGVPLSLLLKEAGVQSGARFILSEGAERARRSYSFPLQKAMDDVIVAYGQNGEALRPEQGYPVRLVVPGWQGHFSTKWLRRIKVVDEPYTAQQAGGLQTEMGPDGKLNLLDGPLLDGPLVPRSIITFPSGGQQVPGPRLYEIRGLAWSGGGVVRRVEVSTDGGRTWKDAELQEPVHRKAHTRFRLAWNWNGEETVLQSRCTDEQGRVEPVINEVRAKYGDKPDDWQVAGPATWLVTREGRVYNATYGPHMTPPPATPDTAPSTALNLNPGRKLWSC